MPRDFHIGDVLTITHDRLVSPRHVEGVYDILNYMTGDNLFTHQLPRAAGECKPWLLRQHPALAGVDVATLDAAIAANKDGRPGADLVVQSWVAEQAALYGETLTVEPIPRDDHDVIDPGTEAETMFGPDRVIVVTKPED